MTDTTSTTVRHLVIFRYKPQAEAATMESLAAGFRDLADKIPGIVGFEHGENISTEGLNQGYQHAFMVTFDSQQARDTYLPHPEHKCFVDFMNGLGIVDEVFVIDYSPRAKNVGNK